MNPSLQPLPWQHQSWVEVTTQARHNRLAHALLLMGPPGVGKRHFAKALVAFLLCEARAEYACGACRSCRQYLAQGHPNFTLLQPAVDEKTGKEKRDISIEQVRELTEKLHLTSHYAHNRLALIDPADALNASGVNALLKTIEEPPPGAYLLLVAERPMALAPTLRSRCQRLRFAPPDARDSLQWLASAQGIGDAELLSLAGGAPLKALQIHQSGLQENYIAWARGLSDLAAQRRDPLTVAGTIEKDQVVVFLAWLQQWLTALLRSRVAGTADPAMRDLPVSAITQIYQEVAEAQRRLTGNANPQMVLEALLILWWRIARPAKSASGMRTSVV